MTLLLVKIFVVISFAFMIFMNVLANTKPLYGKTTGDIASKYKTLFTPSGFAFSIWGLIYILLTLFTIVFITNTGIYAQSSVLIGLLFGVSSLLNGLWLNFWHQDKQGTSSFIMIGMLLSLGMLYIVLKDDSMLVRLPISVYLAWISVATLAQLSILLYPYKPRRYNVEVGIFLGVIVLGTVLGSLMSFMYTDWIFSSVILWGYYGIYSKHKQESNQYIQWGVLSGMMIIIISIVFSLIV